MTDRNAAHGPGKPGLWVARWIAFPYTPNENAFYLARSEFDLPLKLPPVAHVYVSARLKYRLWINGSYAGEGPARSGLENCGFDTWDVAGLLRPGANAVAAEVNNYLGPPCALLLQIDASCDAASYVVPVSPSRTLVGTGRSWRIRRAAEFGRDTPLYAFADYSEAYDFRCVEAGWKLPGFDDTGWEPSELLDPFTEGTVPIRGAAALPIARVSPRTIPAIRHRRTLPASVIETGEAPVLRETGENPGAYMMIEPHLPLEHCTITHPDSLTSPGTGCSVTRRQAPASAAAFRGLYDPYLVLDFGDLVNAYAEIEFEWDEDPRGADSPVSRIGAASRPVAGTRVPDSPFATIDVGYSDRVIHGRLQTQPYADMCSADRIVLSSTGATWRSFHWRQFRYLQISVRGLRGTLRLRRVTAVRCEYPFAEPGRFWCSDSDLNRLWAMSRRTIELCTYDNFMDNGLREKQPWTGDIATIVAGVLAMFGDDPVIRRYFDTNIGGQRPSGILPGHWPETSVRAHSVSPEGNVLWFEHPMALLLRLSEYVHQTGRRKYGASFLPGLDRYLDLLEQYADADGVLVEIPGKHWIDWAPVTLRGAALVTNVWYAEILRFVANLRTDGSADELRERAVSLRREIAARCWDEARGLFRDAADSNAAFSEHSNYTALLYGLLEERVAAGGVEGPVEPALSDALIEALRGDDVVRVEPSFMHTPLLALVRTNRRRLALAMIRERYRIWLDAGYTTLPEEWHPNATFRSGEWRARTRALAQAASCGLPAVLAEGVLGVAAVAAAFDEVRVQPAVDQLDRCEGSVPTPHGAIGVAWVSDGVSAEVTVSLPDGVCGVFVCPESFAIAPPTGGATGEHGGEARLGAGSVVFRLVAREAEGDSR